MQYPGAGKLPRDQNSVPAMGAASLTDVNANTVNATILPLVIDDATNRLLVTAIVTSNALPTGAATLAEQQSQTTKLTSIDGKLPVLGQALAASSVPVVLTAAQLATLTPLSSVIVTNAGTFAVQATPVAQADTFMLGGVNVKEINGVAPLMGAGNTGTGSPRVTIASDQASIPVAATLSNETTKVLGVTRTADGAGNLLTSNSTTFTAKFGLDNNLLGVLGTAFTAAGKINIHGGVATNVAITDNPINQGAQAVSSENAAVTTARQVQLVADLVGKLIVMPYANPENFVNGTTAAITDTTSTAIIASAGGSLRNYITQVTVTNSHATQGTFVKILDGATIIHEGYAAAAGGGFTATFPTPLRGTAATAVNAQPVTTGANIIASASGYKGV